MSDGFTIYATGDLDVVDIRKYVGVQDGFETWILLGFDVVLTNDEGKAFSIFSDEVSYEYLKKIYVDSRKRDFYDHRGLEIGDVRAKVLDKHKIGIFGNSQLVSDIDIKAWISEHPGFHFLNYEKVLDDDKTIVKVKSKETKIEK